jgi:hypothetical protein
MRRTVVLCACIAAFSACGGDRTATETVADLRPGVASSQSFGSDVQKDLAALRQATAAFHEIDVAGHAGWGAQITDCMTSALGGMGFHFGNTKLFDGSVRVDEPELLLYEPEQNGRMRLVAVEYIIPYAAHARTDAPPELFGQQFKQVDAFQLWGLHAWVWKDNPSGMFADWNPNVTCDHAPATTTMSPMDH